MATEATPASSRRKHLILLSVLFVLLGLSLAWNLLANRQQKVIPYRTKATDFVATWRCLACGHEAEDLAGSGPRTCPNCGRNEFYTSIRFSCATHGVFRVAFNYDSQGRPSQVKVADGPWVPYVDKEKMKGGVVCPECGGALALAEAPRQLDQPPADEEH